MLDKLRNLFSKSIVIIVFLALWELFPRLGWVDSFILPPFSAVFVSWLGMVLSGEIFAHLAISLQRMGSGFLLAVAVGVPLGILMGWFSRLEQYLDPLLQVFRNTSVLAMFPVFILLFGLGETSKVTIIFWGSIWSALLSTIGGVKNIDPLLIKAARSMGISVIGLFRKVILPAALPAILTGIRLSAGTATIILVAAEMLGATKGLGFLIFYSEQKYEIPAMYAGIITISLLGVLINALLVFFEKRITGWKEKEAVN